MCRRMGSTILGDMAERVQSEAQFAFKDPANRRDLTFAVLPTASLEVITHQRKSSEPHV